MWWRSGDSAYLLNMQDDSNRFDNRNDFDLDAGGGPPDSWREWAQFPRTGRFKIAVSLSGPSLPPVTAPVTSAPALEIRTDRLIKPALKDNRDADDGRQHGLEYNNELLLRVKENVRRQFDHPSGRRPRDGDVQVAFDFCRVPGTGSPLSRRDRLLGYVTVTTKVGDDRPGRI